MKKLECVPQRISKLMLGTLLMVGALGLVVIGFTLLPIFGFMMAVPVAALSLYVFSLHLNDQCEIDLTT